MKLTYSASEDKLTCPEFVELVTFFDKNLLVGCELERVVPMSTDRVASAFKTTYLGISDAHSDRALMFYKTARARNEYNIAFVTSDGSFEYGNELIYGGNPESFEWNYEHLKKVEDKLTTLGAVAYSPKTSTHISVLTGTDILVKGVVYQNVFNITRAFSGALYWLGSGDKATILRSGARQYAKSCLQITPQDKDINTLKGQIGKYNQINLGKQNITQQDGKQYISGLFVEWRGVDGIRIPSVIAANMMVYKAIVYKAAEMSVHGLVNVESLSSSWQKNKVVVDKLLNSPDTLTDEDISFLKVEAKRLIELLSPYLKRFDKNTIEVIESIAACPASMRQKEGKKLATIDKDIYIRSRRLNEKEQELLSMIIMGNLESDDLKEWKAKSADKLGCSVRYIEKMLITITETTRLNLVFDCEQKAMRID